MMNRVFSTFESTRSACPAVLVAQIAIAALAGSAAAQNAPVETWRLSASAGAFVPRSPIVVAATGRDTQLGAGPAVSLELDYRATSWFAIYANTSAAFTGLTAGTDISPDAAGPSDQVTLLAFTGGALLTVPTGGWLGDRIEPTIRLGGGVKGYAFELDRADSQWRPTGDIGVGFRGLGTGPIGIATEVRFLPSSFDQAKLPTRGIVPQEQRQSDLLFMIAVTVRP